MREVMPTGRGVGPMKAQTGKDIEQSLMRSLQRVQEPPKDLEREEVPPKEEADPTPNSAKENTEVDIDQDERVELPPELRGLGLSFLKPLTKAVSAYVDEELYRKVVAFPNGRAPFIKAAIKAFHPSKVSVVAAAITVQSRYEAQGGLSLGCKIDSALNEALEKSYLPLIASGEFSGLTRSKYVAGCIYLYAIRKGLLPPANKES